MCNAFLEFMKEGLTQHGKLREGKQGAYIQD